MPAAAKAGVRAPVVAGKGAPVPPGEAFGPGIGTGSTRQRPNAPRPGQAHGPAVRVAAPAAPRAGGAFSSQDIDRVYSQYVAARGRNAERTDNIKRETIEKTIRGMLPGLEQKHAGKKIDFEVVVKDGRVALKPVAK